MTLNEIEQRLSALKSEQDKLTAELERLKSEQAEVKPWRAEPRKEIFHYITATGSLYSCLDEGGVSEKNCYEFGNYYRTRELAEQDAKELALRGRIRQLRDALCEGYQFVYYQSNYYIFYNHSEGEYQVDYVAVYQSISEIYFDTREHAQQACDILNAEMRERNKQTNC